MDIHWIQTVHELHQPHYRSVTLSLTLNNKVPLTNVFGLALKVTATLHKPRDLLQKAIHMLLHGEKLSDTQERRKRQHTTLLITRLTLHTHSQTPLTNTYIFEYILCTVSSLNECLVVIKGQLTGGTKQTRRLVGQSVWFISWWKNVNKI